MLHVWYIVFHMSRWYNKQDFNFFFFRNENFLTARDNGRCSSEQKHWIKRLRNCMSAEAYLQIVMDKGRSLGTWRWIGVAV